MVSLPLNLFHEASTFGKISNFQENMCHIDDYEPIYRDFINVIDVATLVMMIEKSGKSFGMIDVGSGMAFSIYHLAELIKKIFTNSSITIKEFDGNWETYQKYTRADLSWVEKTQLEWIPARPEVELYNYLKSLKDV
jgi:UDP-glucose 4-epimerase